MNKYCTQDLNQLLKKCDNQSEKIRVLQEALEMVVEVLPSTPNREGGMYGVNMSHDMRRVLTESLYVSYL